MTNGTTNENYNYDDVGNRTSSHRSASYNYQTGQFNRVSATASENYAYDANGNTVTKIEGKNFWRFTWDYENRLTRASTRKQTVRYRYDALGRRVQRYFAGTKENTKFIYDGQDVLVDDNSGTLTKYLNGDGIDNKLRVQTGNDVKYFLADHLGSTNALTDASGNLSSSVSYDSFGNATGNLSTRYQFTGREFDNFTGLQYSRARWYDANLGRFISEDPIGFAGGDINLYGYVKNNPVNFIDSTGNIPLPLITAAVGGLFGGIGTIIGKGLNNWVCRKGFFDGAGDWNSGYWQDVAIGIGGGIVTGALMGTPLGGSLTGAVLVGAAGNVGQYVYSQAYNNKPVTTEGVIFAGATGGLGGYVGGRTTLFNASSPMRNVSNEIDKKILQDNFNKFANRQAVDAAKKWSSIGRSAGSALVGNGTPGGACGCN
jgi:RHS repeat-associated protein